MNKIVVVMGSGRSGTSLVMSLLYKLGIMIPGELTPASEQNPKGGFEDKGIFDAQMKLLADLGTNQFLPMPEGWENSDTAGRALGALVQLVKDRQEKCRGIWGFKDPKTALLIPLWTRVFNQCKMVPQYILAVRDPGSVVKSLHTQYGTPRPLGEIFWLLKTTQAIIHTGARLFIVHYEDIIEDPVETAADMARHLELENDREKVAAMIKGTVTPKLNRAGVTPHSIDNPDVRELYGLLKMCKGNRFDREKLILTAQKCENRLMAYRGWAMEAQNQIGKAGKISVSTARKIQRMESDHAKNISRLADDQEKLIAENNRLVKENLQYRKGYDRLSGEKARIVEEKKRTQQEAALAVREKKRTQQEAALAVREKKELIQRKDQLKKRLDGILSSITYKSARAVTDAVRRPGLKTLILPLTLIRIFFKGKATSSPSPARSTSPAGDGNGNDT